ncbi:SdiA-regulated family protein [Pedobacter deserti]|uniref:SdiA-regulated family protein n=1 Tax=Pedobacter deserti TaxID=2817382 RepID=UPI0021093E80|nr:SdiA-regulated family protein [Pedobacter sp. SYSU D00382]
MRRIETLILFSVIAPLVFVAACARPKTTSPGSYDLTKPEKFKMPSSLLEISGIALYNGRADTIYSIQDEEGKLFRQAWGIKKQQNTKFAKNGDFEDIGMLGERIFVLKSNGRFYSFLRSEAQKKVAENVKEYRTLLPKGEYESLFADSATNKLYVLCKSCTKDKKTKRVSGYIFNYLEQADSLYLDDEFSIDLEQLKKINVKLRGRPSPSAMAKKPDTGEWYILLSANKLLIVTGQDWSVKEAHRLNSSVFNQPEGIAFDKDMNLYISNEGDEITDGNILKFTNFAR